MLIIYRYLSDAVEGSKTHTSSHLASLRIFYERGLPWAKAAAQEVMPLADQPTLERIQTLECIQLFWFARGDLRRAKIYYCQLLLICRMLVTGHANIRDKSSGLSILWNSRLQ